VIPSSDKETIQHQFDTVIKKNMKGLARNYLHSLSKRSEKEICFSELPEDELNSLCTVDEYRSDFSFFNVAGYEVAIKNELLGEALSFLSGKMRDIVLLSYCLEMSDAEIGEYMNLVRSTIFRKRKTALKEIKEYMEGKTNDR